jgi:FkbM family methyltransferase
MAAISNQMRQKMSPWIALLRWIALRRPHLPGLYRLLRLSHHPDRRTDFYYAITLQATPEEPWFALETRYFTDWQIFFFGTQDKLLEGWICEHVKQNWVCIDIGANIGLYSVHMARRAAYCIAFEPIPRFASRLEQNLHLNSLSNVDVERCALSDCNNQGVLFLPPEAHSNWGASSLIRPQGGEQIPVAMQRLDDFFKSREINRVDLIKIDVEGAEHLVLKGGLTVIDRFQPRIIFENNRESGSEVIKMLGSLGYTFFDLKGQRLESATDQQAIADVLALPRNNTTQHG